MITIVPPIGPPIVVPMGRAIQNKGVDLDSRFQVNQNPYSQRNVSPGLIPVLSLKRSDVFFEDGERKIFPNGTIIYADGSQLDAPVFWGVLDPR